MRNHEGVDEPAHQQTIGFQGQRIDSTIDNPSVQVDTRSLETGGLVDVYGSQWTHHIYRQVTRDRVGEGRDRRVRRRMCRII